MASITLRETKGTPLTNAEIDANFSNLNNAKLETNGSGANLTSLNANNISSGTLAVARGGTGQTSYTNGQLLIGNSTGNTLAKATLTQGSNIAITNGAGSITIATSLTPSFTTVTTTGAGTIGTDLAVNGSNITTTSTGTYNVINANATTVNFAGGASTALNIGNASGALTLRPSTVVGTSSTQNLWNTTATTVNFAGAATTLTIGATTGTTTIRNALSVTGTITGNVTGNLTGNVTGNLTGNVSGTSSNITGIVAAVNGGTGRSSLTLNNVVLGNGTGAVNLVAPGTAGNVLTSDGTTWQSATPTSPIGVGQTWQDVSASRVNATNYTNNTGKPIMVAFGIASTNGFNKIRAYVGGVLVGSHDEATPTSTSGGGSVSFIVPNGAVYNITCSGTFSRLFWSELR